MKNDCSYKDACPYLNFEPAARVLAQRNYLSKRVHEIKPLPIFLSLATNKEDSLIAFQEEFSSPVDKEPKRIRAP